MMQQQISQQDQPGGSQQGMSQQMVLCPVRVVYETQILMQPGDQIQPNQTIFINPQNQPPWIQNRVQNQVLYVHHVPNNILSNVQQQTDQNQLYMQNYSYQIPQQIMTQSPHDHRSLQMTNVPSNMMQSLPNVGPNIQNERNIQMTNFGTMPNQIVHNRQIVSNVGVNQMPNQSMTNQAAADMQRQAYMNMRPQIQLNNNVRQQVMTPQNTHNVQQSMTQTFASNVSQQRPIQVQNNPVNVPRMMQTNTLNIVPNVQMAPKAVQTFASEANTTNNNAVSPTVSNVRNVQSYAYRPIQPRPQIRHNMPNIGALTQPVTRMQNVQANIYNTTKDNRLHNVLNTNTVTGFVNNLDNTTKFNRKRKSESPDEIHNKMMSNPAMRGSENILGKPQSGIQMKSVASNDIGVNTSPVHKNVLNQNTLLQITNNGAQIVKLVDNGQQTTQMDTISVKPSTIDQVQQIDKEKLIRNTVYPQARGRLLNDKELVPVKESLNAQDVNPHQEYSEYSEKSLSDEVLNSKALEIVKIEKNESLLTNETMKLVAKVENTDEAEVQKSGHNVSDRKVEEEESIPSKEKIGFKQEWNNGQQILTHVLDGYVIQESNMAFPIRKPLKEKTTQNNTGTSDDQAIDLKEDSLSGTKTEPVKDSKSVDLPLLPFYYLHLNKDNQERKKEELSECKKENKKNKPFASLQQSMVKSWTVDQLAKHLSKYDWTETISIFQEHEIDGESLFLVSKVQLEQIGVKEDHADAICEFVKNQEK